MRASALYQDLFRDHRDSMYRAMQFISQHGGPAPAGDTHQELIAHRTTALSWLESQPAPQQLASEYEDFTNTWSPVFKD